MPATPKKLNLRRAYSVFGTHRPASGAEQAQEQKTELLEGTRGNGLLQLKNGVDYINAGEEDQMEIYGYQRNKIQTGITWFFIVATGGLLRLFFHWFPHLMLRATHSKCPLEQADTVLLVEKFQGKHTNRYVKQIKTMSAIEVLKNHNDEETRDELWPDGVPENLTGIVSPGDDSSLKLSIHLHGGHFKQVASIVTFTCKKVIYAWDTDRAEFMKLMGLDVGVLTSTLHQSPGLSAQDQFLRRCVYGNNEIEVLVKSFWTLVCLEALNPFYVFQIGSFCLWIADNYVYYAMAILAMSVFGILMAAYQTRQNQLKLRSTVHSSDVATVMRDRTSGKTDSVAAERLVPGDILVIPPHGCLMPCDAVLLTGHCILNESMLTGESVPVTKTPIPPSNDVAYDPKEHARHTLFCGTRVIQTRYYGGEKVFAVVVRTGYNTSKGGLVRSIMYPPPVDFKFEQDSYKLIALLACIASIGMIWTVITKILRDQPAGDIVLEALDLITILVPPALPTAMTVGRLVAQRRLELKRIYCTSPRAVNIAGSIDCICFDKTGTLTEDGLDLRGVVAATEKKFQIPVKSVSMLPAGDILFGMVACHSITIIDGQLVGDPLDLKMFESTGWVLEEPEVSDNTKFSMMFPTIVRPPRDSRLLNADCETLTPSPGRQSSVNSDGDPSWNNLAADDAELAEQGLEIGIVRQFQFTSSLQRMSVITRTLGATHYDLYCKGSPEMILSLSRPESIPLDFSSVLHEYTSDGYRVIALGHKSLNRLTYAKVQRMSREIAEIDLNFLGFVIFENRLKPETSPVIDALNTASIKSIMVTGDNILTALSVARDCDLLRPEIPAIIVTAVTQQQQNAAKPVIYFTRSSSEQSPTSPNVQSISEMTDLNSIASLDTIECGSFARDHPQDVEYLSDDVQKRKYAFALTGKTWATIKQHYPELIPKIATRGAIFARMSPDQKQQLVQELQLLGYCVAMVGDGANDCGALKAAHTGISLSDTESSVASPFTSRETNISCVLSIIRECRAALVTSFGIFKYMAAYSLTQFISVIILYTIDANLTDVEFLYIDLLMISIFACFFGSTQAYDGPLVKHPPLANLLGTSTILSLLLQMIIVAFFQTLSFLQLQNQDWFRPFDATQLKNKDDVRCYENYTVFIVSSMQYIILAVVFSKGHPYRKSIVTNYGLLASCILMAISSTYLAVDPCQWLQSQFELEIPPEMTFRGQLVFYGCANFIVSMIVEHLIVDYLIVGKLRYRWHDVNKSKKKFLAFEHEMADNPKWPPLSHEPLPEAAPDILIRQSTVTEIKIEKKVADTVKHDPSFLNNSPDNFKRFGSAREVTLNPRSLFNGGRNTVSMQTVPTCVEDREMKENVRGIKEISGKRRHNSESEHGIDECKLARARDVNPIATLPRNPVQQVRERGKMNKSEEIRAASVLELDILPS